MNENVVVIRQIDCSRAKVVVLGQKLLYSHKMVVVGKSDCFQAKLLYSGKVVVFRQSCCIRAKWLYSGSCGCILAKWLFAG